MLLPSVLCLALQKYKTSFSRVSFHPYENVFENKNEKENKTICQKTPELGIWNQPCFNKAEDYILMRKFKMGQETSF